METTLLSAATLGAVLALFVAVYRLVRFETWKGERIVLSSVRNGIDYGVDTVFARLHAVIRRMSSRFVTRRTRIEGQEVTAALLRHATRTPLTVTHTDNHLSQIRDYKTETALTATQQRKLRHKKLEERF